MVTPLPLAFEHSKCIVFTQRQASDPLQNASQLPNGLSCLHESMSDHLKCVCIEAKGNRSSPESNLWLESRQPSPLPPFSPQLLPSACPFLPPVALVCLLMPVLRLDPRLGLGLVSSPPLEVVNLGCHSIGYKNAHKAALHSPQ